MVTQRYSCAHAHCALNQSPKGFVVRLTYRKHVPSGSAAVGDDWGLKNKHGNSRENSAAPAKVKHGSVETYGFSEATNNDEGR